jgi:hypothetical protein
VNSRPRSCSVRSVARAADVWTLRHWGQSRESATQKARSSSESRRPGVPMDVDGELLAERPLDDGLVLTAATKGSIRSGSGFPWRSDGPRPQCPARSNRRAGRAGTAALPCFGAEIPCTSGGGSLFLGSGKSRPKRRNPASSRSTEAPSDPRGRRISLYFSCSTGNACPERRVRRRLPPPPTSLRLQRPCTRYPRPSQKLPRFRGVLGEAHSRIRTGDGKFRADGGQLVAFISVAKLGGPDSLPIRATGRMADRHVPRAAVVQIGRRRPAPPHAELAAPRRSLRYGSLLPLRGGRRARRRSPGGRLASLENSTFSGGRIRCHDTRNADAPRRRSSDRTPSPAHASRVPARLPLSRRGSEGAMQRASGGCGVCHDSSVPTGLSTPSAGRLQLRSTPPQRRDCRCEASGTPGCG